ERILAARSIRQGGLGAALAEMAFGNGIGAQLTHPAHTPGRKSFFTPAYGSLILEIADTPAGEKLTQTLFAWPTPALPIGHTTAEPHIAWATDGDKHSLPLRELQTAWESPLESTFPTRISM
ncbi:MAG: hypothetical protein LBD14_06795, partial [Puniceicoccales bacterium]|nr:hypothetical protein [Puniceicoccales bacterium]